MVDGAFVAGHHRIELQATEPQRRRLGKRVLHQRAPDPTTARLGNHGVARVGHVPAAAHVVRMQDVHPQNGGRGGRFRSNGSVSVRRRPYRDAAVRLGREELPRPIFVQRVGLRERVARLHDPVPCPQHAREVFFAIRADEKGCGRPLIGLSRAHVSSIRRFSRCTHKA